MGDKIKGIQFFQRLPKDAQEKVIDRCMDISAETNYEHDHEYECSFLNYIIECKYSSLKYFLYSTIKTNSYWEDIINKYS